MGAVCSIQSLDRAVRPPAWFQQEVHLALLVLGVEAAIGGIYNCEAYWEERVAMHQWWNDDLD